MYTRARVTVIVIPLDNSCGVHVKHLLDKVRTRVIVVCSICITVPGFNGVGLGRLTVRAVKYPSSLT